VPAAVRASELRNPFTREPFTWDARESTISFEGPRANGRQRVQTYLY